MYETFSLNHNPQQHVTPSAVHYYNASAVYGTIVTSVTLLALSPSCLIVTSSGESACHRVYQNTQQMVLTSSATPPPPSQHHRQQQHQQSPFNQHVMTPPVKTERLSPCEFSPAPAAVTPAAMTSSYTPQTVDDFHHITNPIPELPPTPESIYDQEH